MRAFIAVDVSEEVRESVASLVRELDRRVSGARWISSQNLHLTLRFLGATDERALGAIRSGLQSIASRVPPFRLVFEGVGLFPSSSRPRVAAALVAHPPQELQDLQRQVEEMAVVHGFPRQDRAFSPHLTFARFRKPDRELRRIREELVDRPLGAAAVEDVVLFQSNLKRSGAVYQALARFPLGAHP
jgi:RNA 2',3'-cyclic 3'-phosphodiesterase